MRIKYLEPEILGACAAMGRRSIKLNPQYVYTDPEDVPLTVSREGRDRGVPGGEAVDIMTLPEIKANEAILLEIDPTMKLNTETGVYESEAEKEAEEQKTNMEQLMSLLPLGGLALLAFLV